MRFFFVLFCSFVLQFTVLHSSGIIPESHFGQRKVTETLEENLSVLSVANVVRYSPEELLVHRFKSTESLYWQASDCTEPFSR